MKNVSLKLLTINTWKCDGPYHERMAVFKRALDHLQPDVIACQEVFRTATTDTGRELAGTLNMHYQFAPGRYKTRTFDGEPTKSYSGLGLLSRYPIQQSVTLLLPTDVRDGERMAQYSLIDCNGLVILVINTHLTHLRNSSSLRIQQLDALLSHPLVGQHNGPIFLCGDFNAELSSPELQHLLGHPTLTVRDAYEAGNGPLPGITMPARSQSIPAKDKRIDFIFSIANAHTRLPAITDAQVVLDEANEAGIYPSDHCGVMIQAELTQP